MVREKDNNDHYWEGVATGAIVMFFILLAIGIADYRHLF